MTRRRLIEHFAIAVALLAAGVTPAVAQSARPNVVVMMVDNTGWGELGVYGGGVLRGGDNEQGKVARPPEQDLPQLYLRRRQPAVVGEREAVLERRRRRRCKDAEAVSPCSGP